MKRAYEKPMILFEDFCLCDSANNPCEVQLNTMSDSTCGYAPPLSNRTIFLSGMVGCNQQVGDIIDGQWNTICYHVPDGYNLFGS